MSTIRYDDSVHLTQQLFRKLLDGLSRPGTIQESISKKRYAGKLFSLTMDIARTVLDREATFHVVGEDEKTIDEIVLWTLAIPTIVEEADFIFVPENTKEKERYRAIEQAKIGDLLYPNESATIIVECQKIQEKEGCILEGPGIKSNKSLLISGAEEWVHIREEKNAEYPMGIDIFCIDTKNQLIGLPRTTQMK